MKTIENVFDGLKNWGLMPQKEERAIAFNYQMKHYLYLQDENDEEFFAMYLPRIFDVTDGNRLEVLMAVNAVNDELKVVKLVVKDDEVWCCFENELQKDANLEEILPYSVVTLYHASGRFMEHLKAMV